MIYIYIYEERNNFKVRYNCLYTNKVFFLVEKYIYILRRNYFYILEKKTVAFPYREGNHVLLGI